MAILIPHLRQCNSRIHSSSSGASRKAHVVISSSAIQWIALPSAGLYVTSNTFRNTTTGIITDVRRRLALVLASLNARDSSTSCLRIIKISCWWWFTGFASVDEAIFNNAQHNPTDATDRALSLLFVLYLCLMVALEWLDALGSRVRLVCSVHDSY